MSRCVRRCADLRTGMDKSTINLTDEDARMMKTRQGFTVAYNAQAHGLRSSG